MNIEWAIKSGAKILNSKLIPNSYLDSEILLAKTINRDMVVPSRVPLISLFIANWVCCYKTDK